MPTAPPPTLAAWLRTRDDAHLGALLAAAVFVLVLREVARAPEGPGWRCATLVCAAGIMLVGHGAWQGWWIATLGAAAVWFARVPKAPASPRLRP